MSTEQNKAVVRRIGEEYWNQGNVAVLDDAFAADVADHNAPPGLAPGREGVKQFNTMFRGAFSDLSLVIDDLIAEGDNVVWRWTFTGTHTGPLMGISATGKHVTLQGISIDRFEQGKIVERWLQADMLGMMQQLGAIPAPGAGGA